jgi:hypothetical protein
MFPSCVESYALYAKVLQETLDFEKADQMYKKVGRSTKNLNCVKMKLTPCILFRQIIPKSSIFLFAA